MVLIKDNSLKLDIFFNPIFIPMVFQGPGSGFRSSDNAKQNSFLKFFYIMYDLAQTWIIELIYEISQTT